ncbi:MAG: 23S rRNA (adenine(2503)-C(2))-methyltransferase RlmN [Pirellulales bacterium]
MKPFLDLSAEQLKNWLAEHRLPVYRAGQIRRWLFESRVGDFEEMTNLPKSLRKLLAAEFTLWSATIAQHHQASDGTEKLLLELHDGQRIECVLLRDRQKRTICISTQVGCAMGCVFCASGLDGVIRNLSTGEILEQMLRLNRLQTHEERLSHIVVMGMGEPLANLKNLLPPLADATNAVGLGISARRITVSTVGLPEGIRTLAQQNLPYHLAVSLHAPDDELRSRLVPVNKNIGIAAILEAAEEYFAATGRRLTFEYVLLAGLNDSEPHARRLAAILQGKTALVNVIPFNPVSGLPYKTPSDDALARFVEVLERAGIGVKVRRRRGDKIDAACGQLRRSAAESPAVAESGAVTS